MSNHFTYEIDERKLRVKLKDLELPVDESIWRKFEDTQASLAKQNNSNVFNTLQIPVNRNMILPVVFGLMVLLFSYLLYKFININTHEVKSNPPSPTETISIKPAEPTLPDSSQTRSNKGKSQETTPSAVVSTSPNASKQQPTAMPSKVVSTPSANPSKEQDTPVTTSKNVLNGLVSTTPTLSAVNPKSVKLDSAVKKKVEKRRDANDILETETAPDTRPSINIDDRETSGRPNK